MTLKEFERRLKEYGRGKFFITTEGAIRIKVKFRRIRGVNSITQLFCPIVYIANRGSKKSWCNSQVVLAAAHLGLSKLAVKKILIAADFPRPESEYRFKLKKMLDIQEAAI